MNKQVIIAFVLLCAGIALSGIYGPWYAPAVVILVICALLTLRMKQAVLLGLVAGAFVYVLMALIMLNHDDAGIISKTGNLLGGLSPLWMSLVTMLIGAVTGLLSAWLGSALRQTLLKTTN